MKIDPKEFQKAFAKVSDLAGKRATLPILSSVLISSDGSKMDISASDERGSATATMPCEHNFAPICVHAGTLGKIVAGVGDREFELEISDGKLLVKSPFRASIPVLPGSDFIELPKPKTAECIGVNCEDLIRAIKSTAWAADAAETIKDIWRGAVRIVTSTKSISSTATDMRALAHIDIASIGAASEAMLPCQYAGKLIEALSGDNADYFVSENHVFGVCDGLTFSSTQFAKKYPPVAQFLASERKLVGNLEVKVLLDEILLCASVVHDQQGFTRCSVTFSESGIGIEAKGDGREFQSSLPGSFAPTEMTLSASVVAEVLKHCTSEKVDAFVIGGSHLLIVDGDLSCAISGLAKLV